MPSAQDYRTIGDFYEAIRQNLKVLAERLGQENLFLGSRSSQLGPDAIEMAGINTIGTLDEALRAIDLIVEQGEGSPGARDTSHFHTFLDIRNELEALELTKPHFSAAWSVADNPVLRQPPEPEDKTFVSFPEAAQLLDFTCATYRLLLRVIIQAFARPDQNPQAMQSALMDTVFSLMHILGTGCANLARLPASNDEHGTNAGMTFTMLRGVEPLAFGRVESAILSEQLYALAEAAPASSAELRTATAKLAREFSLGDCP